MENFQKISRKNKNKLRVIYPKSHGNFKNSKPRVQFYWFLLKKSVRADFAIHTFLATLCEIFSGTICLFQRPRNLCSGRPLAHKFVEIPKTRGYLEF